MALPLTEFSLRDVEYQYGANTKPTPLSLKTFLADIFGSWAEGEKLSKFGGYGQPIISSFAVATSTTDGGKIKVDYTIDVGSLSTVAQIQYQEDDGTLYEEIDWVTATESTHTTNGSHTVTITLPKTDTSYWIRVRAYNKFVEDSVDDYIKTTPKSVMSSSPEGLTAPSISSCSNDGSFQVTANFYHDNESITEYEAQIRRNGGTWYMGSLVSSTNWNSSDPNKSGTWSSSEFFSAGDTIDIQVRAVESSTVKSDWSGICTSTA